MSRYERLGASPQRLGSFEGTFGSAATDLQAAQAELQQAQQALQLVQAESSAPIRCAALPNQPMMARLSCPTTAADATAKLQAAASRVKAAQAAVKSAQDAVDAQQTGEVLTGIAAIAAPLAQAGAQIGSSLIQAQTAKAQLKRQGVATPEPIVMSVPASGSNTGLIIGGLLAAAAVVGLVVMMSGKKS